MKTAKWYEEKIREHYELYKNQFGKWVKELRKYPTTALGRQEKKDACDWYKRRADEEWALVKRYENKLAEMGAVA